MSQKRKRAEEQPGPSESAQHIFRSEKIEDRSSTFKALFSPTLKPKELQSLPEIKDASHKILAWRRVSNQQSITGGTKYVTGHDDDGEKYAGKRVEKVLEDLGVEGACVVARWYGGVLLGPVRFTHIERCAREAIEKWRRPEPQAGEKEDREVKKPKKEEDDINEKPRLVKTLVRRDESIAVLRQLAKEKEDEVKNAKLDATQAEAMRAARGEEASAEAAKPVIDYEKMPVDRLRALERARDATLSFLLKRIDKAEEEMGILKPMSVEEEQKQEQGEPP